MRRQVRTDGIHATLSAIGGKWKPMLLFILLNEGTKRFGELRRMLPGITHGMLSNQLRELERDSLIVRNVYEQVPPKVEYRLSEHGHTLARVLTEMCNWGFVHQDFIRSAGDPEQASSADEPSGQMN